MFSSKDYSGVDGWQCTSSSLAIEVARDAKAIEHQLARIAAQGLAAL